MLGGCEPASLEASPPEAPSLGEVKRELDGTNIVEYAASCRAALGTPKKPYFRCRDGSLLKTTNTPDGAKCDKPVWLTLDGDGQCVTNARLLKLETSKADTEMRVICRRYKKGADTEDGFQDVAIVMSNKTSGATCYFQALSGAGPDLDGSKVPNPLADPASTDTDEKTAAAAAKTFYIAPERLKLADTLACSQCHDHDPWMHTPYIDQVDGTDANHVPTDFTDAKYYLVEEAYFTGAPRSWPKPRSVTTADVKDANGNLKEQVCTSCHRIGTSKTCDKWVDWAVDATVIPATNAAAQTYSAKMWMPTSGKPAAEEDYHKKFDNHVKAIKCCCKKPWALGCTDYADLTKPDTGKDGDGKKPGSTTVTDKCVFDTGRVALGVSIAPYVVAARSGGDESCTTPLTTPVCASFSIERLLEDGTTTTINSGPNGNPLKACGTHPQSPYPGPHESNIDVEAGDLVTISAPQTYAFGASHELYVFTGWNVSPNCPCTSPGPTCQFRTKGASNWFNPASGPHPYAGDPSYFQCQALYAPAGLCKSPDAGVDAGTDAGVDAGTDAGLDAGTDAGMDAGSDAGTCDGGFCPVSADAGVLICDGGIVTMPLGNGQLVQTCQSTDPPPL
ncbi:hypothetical protein JY651_05875 [Pyxidicoccus parkwayensis]|uniref:Lipoprotein n=1 Tax=Pyxidicoccus parkwayensis TaxID=2813578 RepID=A0ABX7PDS0_9BACT|nr:hypothetical protein [Pyxidicoccus parkwaysis]QSQ28634.1 hypothetical protein JY651_05875 [Pyxidicoccus parkwaysis]